MKAWIYWLHLNKCQGGDCLFVYSLGSVISWNLKVGVIYLFILCIKQTYVDVCMLIEVVETVSLRYIHCLEWHHLATMGFFSTPISEFCFPRVCNNHMFNPCLFLKYLLSCNCRSRGDCVTIYWHALCEHGITASHFLLHLPWTHSCGTILSQNDISC